MQITFNYLSSCSFSNFSPLTSAKEKVPILFNHFDLSQIYLPHYSLGERIIVTLEAIALLGALALIIKRVVTWAYKQFYEDKSDIISEDCQENQPLNLLDEEISFDEASSVESKEDSATIPPPIHVVSKKRSIIVNEEKFKKHLFSSSKLIQQNKTLLENTTCKAKCRDDSVICHTITPIEEDLESLLNETADLPLIPYSFVENWFGYTDENHFYIDFAHATSFGGGYRSHGGVQEERMFAEFLALARLDYTTKNGIHPCVDSYSKGGHSKYPPEAKPAPFIIESIYRQFDITNVPYGFAFRKASDKDIIKGIQEVIDPVPVNIIGLAAYDWRSKRKKEYTIDQQLYHLNAAYLAFSGAKTISSMRDYEKTVVHTAPWGCGAFKNSEKMMTAIQYLAARMAGVELVFYGVGNKYNEHYDEEDILQVIEQIDNFLEAHISPKKILEKLLEKSKKDLSWAPKK